MDTYSADQMLRIEALGRARDAFAALERRETTDVVLPLAREFYDFLAEEK